MIGSSRTASKPIYRIYEITLTDAGYNSKSTYRIVSNTAESAIKAAKQHWKDTSHLSYDPAPDAVWVQTGDAVDVIDTGRSSIECTGCKSQKHLHGREPQHAVDG